MASQVHTAASKAGGSSGRVRDATSLRTIARSLGWNRMTSLRLCLHSGDASYRAHGVAPCVGRPAGEAGVAWLNWSWCSWRSLGSWCWRPTSLVGSGRDAGQLHRSTDSGSNSTRSAGRYLPPTTPQQAAIRRRDIGSLLALCMLVTLAGALATGSLWALGAFVCMFGLAASYAGLVVRRRRAAPTAEVHYLPLRDQSTPSTVKMVRRTANE